VSKYGRLDAIWANAGVSGGLGALADQTVEHWMEILRINLIGPFLAIKICHAAYDRTKVRLDRLHRVGGGPEIRRVGASLWRQQGRRHQPGADHRLFAVRHRGAHQTRYAQD